MATFRYRKPGYVALNVTDLERSIAFYRDAVLKTLLEQLEFRASDHFGDQVSFLRCFPNPYHHSFGVARGEDDRFHHVNFMVTEVDDIGRALNRFKKHGVEIVYGPGRHD